MFDKNALVNFARALKLKGIDHRSRSGWVIARCPFATWRHKHGTDKDPSFGLKVGKDFCHCFSCHFSGDLETMLYRLAVYARGNKAAGKLIGAANQVVEDARSNKLVIGKLEEEVDPNEILQEWPEWHIANHLPAYDHPYLATRAGGPVPKKVAAMMDFRLDRRKQRLGVPVRDFDGRLMGFHARTINGHEIPYLAYRRDNHWNKPVWLGEHWVDMRKPVLIAESVFDLARCLQVYRNSISPLMAGIPWCKIERIAEAMQIVCLLDEDKAGALGLAKLKDGLPDSQVIAPGLPDGYDDAGETEVDVLAARLEPYLDLDKIIR